jgi:hypothetical protein
MGKGGKVESKKYSWGTMKTVHHGADFSIPLHPEHHQEIAKLKDQQEHKFKDETGRHWTAKKMGDNIHFQGANGGGTTHVPAHTMKEEVESIEEAKPGLYANINAKRKRIEAGSGERMRKPGSEGAPSAKDFKDAAKTVKEAKDEQEYGYEGDMALNQLATLIRCGEMIKDMLKPDTDMPEWVQSKITLATDYIQTAADYMYSELKEGVYSHDVERAFPNGKASGVKTHAPVAPVPPKKKEQMKPRVGHPTAQAKTDDSLRAYYASKKKTNEEVEEISELSKTTLGNYYTAAKDDNKANADSRKSGDEDEAKSAKDRYVKRLTGMGAAKQRLNKEETLLGRIAQLAEAMKKCKSCGEKHEGSCSYNEDAKSDGGKKLLANLKANHREFASQGKMHPDMAKHMTVGQEHDYYEHGTGDKVSGKVMHKSATEVHMKQTHDSYDPKKKGTVHKFKISDKMDEEVVSEEQGYTLQSKHTNADGTTTVTLKSPDGKIKKHTGKDVHKVVKRMYGVQSEEVVQEKINMDKASMGDVIKDFKNSDAPQFKGKSDEKRRQMAIAAKLSAQRNEEEEMTLSFKDYLNEVKLADLPVRKVSGSYGTEYYKKEKEKDEKGYDSEDSEKSSPEKRGRGRPKGASSGARQKGSTTGKKRSGVEMTGYPLHLPNR